MSETHLIAISGPSGCGKTTIAREILRRHPELMFSVSATTRPMREVEHEGTDYYFISREEFEEKIRREELIEWENIYGDFYGTPRSEVDRAAAAGKILLLDVDVKGALSIRKRFPEESFLIFIEPPSIDVLRQRLAARKTETPETIERRMARAAMELAKAPEFDFSIVNENLATAIEETDRIVREKLGIPAPGTRV